MSHPRLVGSRAPRNHRLESASHEPSRPTIPTRKPSLLCKNGYPKAYKHFIHILYGVQVSHYVGYIGMDMNTMSFPTSVSISTFDGVGHAIIGKRENGMRVDTYAPDIYSRETYRKTYQENFHPVLNENYLRDAPCNLTFYPPNMNKERGRKQGT
ncbi:hypothetical protein M9H77_28157 [Catharanthus roseus]|uniref:Uncharacterized protein n=1 Tax=Catharanthus roseus TaxID=4058 RepID=A0ACC0AEX5_CATRO|nr:hypothetical protein M9H77_28157 [Catharanthus roseus]